MAHKSFITGGLALVSIPFFCYGGTFPVTVISDSGAGSLRQAILDANNTPGANLVTFNITGGGVQIIAPFSELPAVTNQVTIDATTQPGYAGTPLIVLSGSSSGFINGLTIAAPGCAIKGLVVGNFGSSSPRHGVLLLSASNTVTACYVGVSETGAATRFNHSAGILISNAPGNMIGGLDVTNRNLIGGNITGVFIIGASASNNVVLGNWFSLSANGSNTLVNSTDIIISNAPNNIIGGNVAAARNVLAGSQNIVVNGGAAVNGILGNYLNLLPNGSPTSTSAGHVGILVQNATGTVIGGPGAGNVISGCDPAVKIPDATTTGTVIQGNYFGTDPTGLTPDFNYTSISISGSSGNLIGGTMAGAGNVIVGKGIADVSLNNGANNNVVQGNFIGTDATGMNSLHTGNLNIGVLVAANSTTTTTNNLIGGATAGARNVISGLTSDGVQFNGLQVSNNVVQGNYLGVAADGVTALGNGGYGAQCYGAQSNLITGNIIANSTGGAGVYLYYATNNLVLGNIIYSNVVNGVTMIAGPNVISQNSIYNNGGLGIDDGGDGPTPNTPNGNSNYPILTLAHQGSTDIDGSLNAAPNCIYHIEFYSNDPSDTNPEAKSLLGSINVPTDGSGNLSFQVSFTKTVPIGSKITATATATCPGNPMETSEISQFTIVVGLSDFGPSPLTYANHAMSGTDRDPISLFTGELFVLLPPDLALGGPLPLVFQRYYAAFLKQDGLITGKLGDNWLHNFEMILTTTSSNTVNIVNNQGRLIPFTNSAGSFILLGQQDIPFQLATNAGNYILGDPRSQMLYTFDSSGKLTTIADGHGNAQTLSYTGSQLANVTDGLGRTLTFQYSNSGFLTNVSDGTRSVGFIQTGNNLTSASDALGFVTTYTYDTVNPTPGLMTAAVEPQGNVPYSQIFNASGQVLTQTEAGTNTTSLIYSNNTATIFDPISNVRQQVHTATGQLASFTDESGQTIAIGSNPTGQRSSVTDRLGRKAFIGYHAPSGGPAALTNADGDVTSFIYSSRVAAGITFYDVRAIIYPDGTTESLVYDVGGNVLTHTDRAGQVFSFGYNSLGQALTTTNPLGGVTMFTYDVVGRLATCMDTDTGLTTFQYDSLDRLTNVIHPDGTTRRFAFDANDRLMSLKDERNNVTSFAYDQNDRLVSVTDANLQVTHFAYDNRDRLTQTTDRLGHSLGFSYDTLDHVATLTNRNGFVTTLAYDGRRRLTAITDPGGRVWNLGYDNESFLLSASNPLGQTDAQGLNAEGNAIAFTNALGQVSSVARDAMQQTTNSVDEINRTNGFGYEARGLLASTTAPLIGTANYQRNNLGLLSGITGLNGEQWDFAYTSMGRLQALTDPLNRTNVYSYDNRGRLQRIGFADGIICSNSYDQASNPTRRQYSSGPDLQFTYDSLNRLASANDLAFAYDLEDRVTNTVSSGVNQGAAYDAGGRLTSVTCQNGAFTVNYTYDSRDRLTQVGDTLTGTQINFTYDDAGRLTGITRPNGVNGTYTYDAAGRLTRIQEGSIIDIQYTVDAAGQVVAANFTAPLDPATLLAPAIPTFAYDAAHQIKNSGYAFDARGRQTASSGHAYQWDGASRLVGIDGVALAYNGANDLETRTSGGVTTRYFYNHALGLTPIMAERNENTLQVQRFYVWTPGGQLLYLIDATSGNAVRFFHYDRVGSTLALTASNGSVTDAYAYSPYGVLLGHSGTNPQPFTYIGEFGVRGEPSANLYHMRARYYDPITARFLCRDPLWPKLEDSRSLDPYQYASENPLSYIDPIGLNYIGYCIDGWSKIAELWGQQKGDPNKHEEEYKAETKRENQAERAEKDRKASEAWEEKWRAQEQALEDLNNRLRYHEFLFDPAPERDRFKAVAEIFFNEKTQMINGKIQEIMYEENKSEYYMEKGMSEREASYRAHDDLRKILSDRSFDFLSKTYLDSKSLHLAIKDYNQAFEEAREARRNATHTAAGPMGRAGMNPTAADAAVSGGGEVRVVSGVKLEFLNHEQNMAY